jgi:hypothetical protein
MGLHPVLRESFYGRRRIGAFDVVTHQCCGIGFIDLRWQTELAPLCGQGLGTGFVMVGIEPQACKAAMRIGHVEVAVLLDFGLDGFAVQRRVEVKVHTKAIAVFVVHRCNGR